MGGRLNHLIEPYMLVDPESESAKAFQAYAEPIARRILKNYPEAQKCNLYFYLSSDVKNSARIHTNEKDIHVTVEQQILEKLNFEDELAALLGHEFSHKEVFERVGHHIVSNPEEAGSDIWPVFALQNSGYAPEAALDLEKIINSSSKPTTEKEKLEDAKARYADHVHPPGYLRIRNIENALAVLEQKKALNKRRTRIPAEQKKLFLKDRHISFLDRLKSKAEYQEYSTIQKVEYLSDILFHSFEELQKLYKEEEKYASKANKNKIKDKDKSTKRQIDITYYQTKIRILTREFVDLANEKSSTHNAIKNTLQNIVLNESSEPQIKKLINDIINPFASAYWIPSIYNLENSIDAFVNSKELSAIEKAASKIVELSQKLPLEHINCAVAQRLGKINTFKLPNKNTLNRRIAMAGPFSLPWHNHMQYAFEQGVDSNIFKALFILGIEDPRIPKHGPLKAIKKASISTLKDAKFNEKGQVIGFESLAANRFIPFATLEQAYNHEADRADSVKQQETNLLSKVDWSLFDEDLPKFLSKYEENLKVDYTIQDYEHPLIDEFVKRLKNKAIVPNSEDEKALISFFLDDERNWTFKDFKHEIAEAFGSPLNQEKRNQNKLASMAGVFADLRRLNSTYGLYQILNNSWNYQIFPRLSITHPYVNYVLQSPLFQNREKIEFAGHVNYMNDDAKTDTTPDNFFLLDMRKLVGYDAPQSEKELIAILEKLNNEIKKGYFSSAATDLLNYLKNWELYSYLENVPTNYLDLSKVSKLTPAKFQIPTLWNRANNNKSSLCSSHKHHFYTLMDEQAAFNIKKDLSAKNSLTNMVKAYEFYSQHNSVDYSRTSNEDKPLLLSRPDLIDEFESAIKDKMKSHANASEITKTCEQILLKIRPKNVEFKNWLIDCWADNKAKTIRNSVIPETIQLKLLTKKLVTALTYGEAFEMLPALLDKMEAQEKISFFARDELYNKAISLGLGDTGHYLGTTNDLALENIADDPNIRQRFLDLIIHPFNDDNARSLIEAIKNSTDNSEFVKFMNDQIPQLADELGKIPESAKIYRIEQLYKQYWSLPFAAKAIYLERILFPIDYTTEQYQDSAALVFDHILPEDQPYATQARKVLKAYLQCSSPPLQRMIMAALVSSSDPIAHKGQVLRPGQILARVLGTSAAGQKILQALHSHDSTPEDIRADLKDSKSDMNRPFRWSIFERMKEVMPESVYKSIRKVGKYLGGGAYGYTVETIRKIKTTATTVLRSDVQNEAEYQFDKFYDTVDLLSQDDPDYEQLKSVLKHAREMAAIESDYTIAANQIKQAEKHYNGLKIKVDGISFDFKTAKLISHGKEYKETERAYGEHFNDLTENTAQEKLYKKAAAKALFTAELYLILKGLPLDHDRHGAQERLKGTNIVVFDHGAMMVDTKTKQPIAPTTEEKLAIGQALVNTYKDIANNKKSAVDSLLGNIKAQESFVSSHDYLHSFKRAILSLGDYRRVMGDNEQEQNQAILDAFTSIMLTGHAADEIMSVFKSSLTSGFNVSALSDMSKQAVSIQDPSENFITQHFREKAAKKLVQSYIAPKNTA